jgi:rare lipoprotein A
MQPVIASYYGTHWNGHRTASGTVFDSGEYICAHRHLPFGTKVTLLNPSNKHVVEVVVVDRGPFIVGRDFDLSETAANALGFRNQGVAKLLVVSMVKGVKQVKPSLLDEPLPILPENSQLNLTAPSSDTLTESPL